MDSCVKNGGIIMNKILLNKNGRNHIKIFPLRGCIEMPEEDGQKIKECEKIFLALQHDDNAIRKYYYRDVKVGHQITVYVSNGLVYLSDCIRDIDRNYITTVYIMEGVDDAINIAKFLRANMKEIGESYKQQIIEGKEEYLKQLSGKN